MYWVHDWCGRRWIMFGYFRNNLIVRSFEVTKGSRGFRVEVQLYTKKEDEWKIRFFYFSTQEEVEDFVKAMGKKKWKI
jgi:hypothetical protein